MTQKRFGSMGASSVLMIFVVLCLTAFGVLSLVSARADLRLTRRAVQAAEEYYAADAGTDALLGPVAPTTAYKLGEKTASPLEMYLGDIYTVPVNIAGIPALSLPCGRDSSGLPIGAQLIGRPLSEETVLRAGHALEGALDFSGHPIA